MTGMIIQLYLNAFCEMFHVVLHSYNKFFAVFSITLEFPLLLVYETMD